MNKQKKMKQKKPVELPLHGISRFLKASGWNVFVIGGKSSIQQSIGSPKYNYELVIRFTGSKRVGS